MAAEIASARGLWSPWRVDSEYRRLRAVLLYVPGPELRGIRSPGEVQHLERVDAGALGRELEAIGAAFRRLGVVVRRLTSSLDDGRWPAKRNLMFARDLFFATREGAVLCRMASQVRAGEEKYAARALSGLAVPLLRTIGGRGLLEGADALWLDERTVVCAVGNRTNGEGARQLQEALRPQAARVAVVPAARGVQHLLGCLQIVDRRRALVRPAAPAALRGLLRRKGFSLAEIPDDEETVERQGFNFVVVAPRTIVMASGCPRLERLYEGLGLRIAARVKVEQLRRAAGGLACATGILSRH